jgi:hypothetical protein
MEDKDHSKSLQAYETSAYKRIWCEANQEDKTGVENCRAFFFSAGEYDSKELEDGSFDLAWYRRKVI